MALSTSTAKIVYTGNGTTGPFSFPFKIFESTDLIVERYTIADGTTTALVVTTDYTISGTFPGTGSVTLVSSLSSSYKLIIRRSVPYTQETDLQENDDLPADTIEAMNDRNVAQVQQVKEIADRAVVLDGSNSSGVTLPVFVDQALKYLRINSLETGIEYGTPTATELDYGASISYGVDASKSASPSTGDIYIATDTFRVYRCFSGGTWTTKLNFTGPVTFTGAGLSLAKGADVASANALTLGTDGNYFDITGTTAITSIGTLGVGTVVKLHFDGILTLTHHATDLILPGGANITTAAGDEAEFVEYASGDWRCTSYTKASGLAVIPFTPTASNALAGSVVQTVYTQTGAVATGTGTIPFDDTIPQNTEGNEFMTRTITPNHADNLLKVTVIAYVYGNVSGAITTGALFKDSIANSLAAMPIMSSSAGFAQEGPPMVFTHYITAGSTSEQTFKFRAGLSSAGTVTFNGQATARRYGGVAASSITIEEIKV